MKTRIAGLFAVITVLLIACLYASAQSAANQPATEADSWGDPVDGVQLRLAVSKSPPLYAPPQLPGDMPHLEMQIRNVGTDAVNVSCYIGEMAQIEIDGVWYVSGGFGVTASCRPPPGLGPGTQSANIPLLANVIDGGKIVSADQIHLAPGKHSIRVRTPSSGGVWTQGWITLVSNAITVEIPDVSPEAEIQVLIKQASAGGTRGLMPARRLVDKRPEAALSAIEAAVQVTPDSRMRSPYVDLAGSLPGDAAVVFLKSQLAPEAGLFSQVSAARALLARGQPDAVLSMIHVWRDAQLVTIPRDTSGLFVANAEANLIMFLATSGDAQAIDALEDNARAPVDVRFAVVKAFLPPPSDPNSVRTSSSGPGGVSSMVDVKIKDLPGSAAAAIERLLRAALDDKGQRVGLKGSYDDISYSDPRVCDIAALAISKRWPQQYRFTWPTSMTERDAQIDLIRSTWSQR